MDRVKIEPRMKNEQQYEWVVPRELVGINERIQRIFSRETIRLDKAARNRHRLWHVVTKTKPPLLQKPLLLEVCSDCRRIRDQL